jgi:GTP-binding protein HflX
MGTVNQTLQDIGAREKPTLTIFNKMDLYEERTFDEWLDAETKADLLKQLERRWEEETGGRAVFVSAIQRRNIDGLRDTILQKVKDLYAERYPYLTQFY